MIKQLRTF
ncbi:hypothetical protein A6R68_12153 [Neotoma lepida]|uniref:Uncharacterized protein n=1 Tax=Neotoma lepida TaxID=56216 RepID=A0A1A6H601_NEOLE|nr:hypothetical protein A6R68_12153 [Neotoma lepida]